MPLQEREKKTAFLVGGALVALLLYNWWIDPLFAQRSDLGGRVDVAQNDLNNDNRTITDATRAERNWDRIGGNNLLKDYSAAQAQLLDKINGWVRLSGVVAEQRANNPKPEQSNGFGRFTTTVKCAGTLQQISYFVWLIENSDVPAKIRKLDLKPKTENTNNFDAALDVSTIFQGTPTPPKR